MNSNDYGKLLLRLTLGGLMLLHGAAKVIKGPAGIKAMLAAAGFPEAFAYLVYVGEILAPALLVIGLFTRPAAIVIAINMVVAVLLAHSADLFSLGKSGGWALELQGFFFLTAVAVALLGPGRISIGGNNTGKWV